MEKMNFNCVLGGNSPSNRGTNSPREGRSPRESKDGAKSNFGQAVSKFK